ncbi:MAG: sortase [Agathobacter sp.]|nr:sortase [Agathobacter sp.]
MLQEVQEQILKGEETTEEVTEDNTEDTEGNIEDTEIIGTKEMATIPVEGYECIGILSIPAIGLEWPVLTDWDYVKLKKAPCLYYGNYYEPDFVIAAHYYPTHFGGLTTLEAGDVILFTAVNGETYSYEVVLLETLPKKATKEMITSGFDLTLYTCTTDKINRVTVRCRKIEM